MYRYRSQFGRSLLSLLPARALVRLLIVTSLALGLLMAPRAAAAQGTAIAGTVVDQLGGVVRGATVILIHDGQRAVDSKTDAQGRFSLPVAEAGRYGVRVEAPGFLVQNVDAFFVAAGVQVPLKVTLSIGVAQAIVVTASADALPTSQVAAAVTVIDRDVIDSLEKPDLSEALRLVPGVNVVQVGGRGNTTSLFVRGGTSAFTKVLMDGVPANDIGGVFDFGDVDTVGIGRVEVMRDANSVLFGNDALTGVIDITTLRGRTRMPEVTYSVDGGTLGTQRHDVSIGGATNRLDYYTAFSHFDTDNDVANNAYRRNSFVTRVGVAAGGHTDISAVFRAGDSKIGLPNATDFYGLSDDSSKKADAQLFSLTAQSRISSRLKTTVRYALAHSDYHLANPTPTGEYYDPFGYGENYLGKPVTITGANGDSVTGQAILDYGGTYPSLYDAATTRHLVQGQASYALRPALNISAGVRAEHESGFNDSGTRTTTARSNSGAFVEAQGTSGTVSFNAGLGLDDNAIYGFAVTPRLSLAAYVRKPTTSAAFGDTKLTLNAGTGIKEPTISQELSSLSTLVKGTVPGVDPIGPERSCSFDVGIEQGAWQGRVRMRAAYFDNNFNDLIEYVSKSALTQLGVTQAAANATAYGAYVNSSSYRARGLELSSDAAIGRFTFMASYMFLDADVTKSLSGGALAPAINPAFPNTPIGQYSPLVGARPFRRPTHSGSLMAKYVDGPLQLVLAGYLSGRSDDSTFLSDGFFGYSLLLPNHNLDAGFQKIDLSGSYAIHPRARWYVSIENLLDQDYEAASGYPALPLTLRTGITFTVGGDGLKRP